MLHSPTSELNSTFITGPGLVFHCTYATSFKYHSVARQCYTVVRAMQQVNGKWQFWGRQNSVTPEPID